MSSLFANELVSTKAGNYQNGVSSVRSVPSSNRLLPALTEIPAPVTNATRLLFRIYRGREVIEGFVYLNSREWATRRRTRFDPYGPGYPGPAL